MKNFLAIAHLDTLAVVAHLFRLNPATWLPVEARGETNNPMIGLGASLLLRGHDDITRQNWLDDLPVEDLAPLAEWDSMQRLLDAARQAIMAQPLGQQLLTGAMARAMVSRLDPGSSIFWHVDDGAYHSRTARFHVALYTNPGCLMYSQGETQHFVQGVLYWFNNHVRHCAANWGETPRLHLIFEMYRKEVGRG